MPFYFVMIGPPGAGKGTQAKELARLLELVHISTGDLFRDNIRAGSALGKRVEAVLASGALVPDDLTIERWTVCAVQFWMASRVRCRKPRL